MALRALLLHLIHALTSCSHSSSSPSLTPPIFFPSPFSLRRRLTLFVFLSTSQASSSSSSPAAHLLHLHLLIHGKQQPSIASIFSQIPKLRVNRLLNHTNNLTRGSSLSCLHRQQQQLIPLDSLSSPHPSQRIPTRFLDIYRLGNKEAIEKECARLKDELNRGCFADMAELKKHGGKMNLALLGALLFYIGMTNSIPRRQHKRKAAPKTKTG